MCLTIDLTYIHLYIYLESKVDKDFGNKIVIFEVIRVRRLWRNCSCSYEIRYESVFEYFYQQLQISLLIAQLSRLLFSFLLNKKKYFNFCATAPLHANKFSDIELMAHKNVRRFLAQWYTI